MISVRLGRTEITVPKNAFGALPIQRISEEDAGHLLQKAYQYGFRFFDTANMYTDSETKIGKALAEVRGDLFLATKTMAQTPDMFWKHLGTSLQNLKTDYIDIYQFHNPAFCPKPGDGTGLYEAMLQAKEQGKIRFIGLTNHRLHIAKEAVESGLYETVQYPFNYLVSAEEEEFVRFCKERDVGFICMKAMSGGLIERSDAAYAYLAQYDNVLPIWGVQEEKELDEFIRYQDHPPAMTKEIQALIDRDRRELTGEFCRGCGYCMPCPMGIEINNCARMSLFLRRAPTSVYLSEVWQEKMAQIETCTDCGNCKAHCPYGLDTPNLLRRNYEDFKSFF